MRMKNFAISLAVFSGLFGSQAIVSEPAQTPIFLISGTESLVMLNMSNDHELFFKAYDDYSDLNPEANDGVDTTYNNNIVYYGYFDSGKCYTYNTSNSRFVPAATMNTRFYCDDVAGDWSGNFLNWATMTRMDAIRKVLYGGYRSSDPASSSDPTVLERQFLPTDAHSFVKYYADTSDIHKLTPYSSTDISICNTTPANSGNSKDVTNPPQMRVAVGNYSMWTAHEVRQCSWSEENNNSNNNNVAVTEIAASSTPPSRWSTGSAEFIVRVEVCNSSFPEQNCKTYPSGNRKPIGLLQEHGEDGSVKFGLMTGSYDKNKSGGVLRKNVGDFRNEVEEDTTGQFTATPTGGGIVDTLDRLRLTRYDYGNRRYNELDSCTFAQFGFDDGECSNWGNPQSELYMESLRYFSGKSATSAFAASDSGYINGLSSTSWTDPLSNDNYCAPVNVIHFNASTSSFDGDQLGGFGDLPGNPDADTETDKVGVGEGITDAGQYFVGLIDGSTEDGETDKSCSPKDLDNLSDASGVCPEAPWLEGTYQIAGMAYYANLNSIRDDLDDVDGNTADVRVKTYGVALSPAQPVIEVPVPGTTDQQVIILPACMEFRNDSSYSSGRRHNGNCAIVDFRVVHSHNDDDNDGTYTGKFMVLWESAQHGGDYDQDMGGVISYAIDGTDITVTTQVYGASTGGIHGFGYVISGTTQDGLHIHSGHNNFENYTDPYGLLDCDTSSGDGNCDSNDPASSITYEIGTTTAKRLETPLYYATKWGGFSEEDDANQRPSGTADPNDEPDQDYEWDADGDDLPDNYFFARNPGELSGKLASVFETIDTISSSASVVANSVSLQTTTRIYQARFDSTDWSGKLLSFPVNLGTGELEDWEWDAGVQIARQNVTGSSWNSTGRTMLTWNGSSGVPLTWTDAGTDPADITDLTAYDDDTTSLSVAQRLALDTNPDDATDVDGLGVERLNYIRGDFSNEIVNNSTIGFRSRRKTMELANGTELTLHAPLGDVVHSTPTIVAAPSFGYRDLIPGTTTPFSGDASAPYSAFKTKYSESECYSVAGNGTLTPITSWAAGTGSAAGSREPMVYFGANDGALHGVSACTGVEKLAYVPESVFPNLGKLTQTDYDHQYYVDGPPTVVDAFWGSAWHTALVGSLGAGGKGIFALDVTDPNNFLETSASSIVLWEINPTTDIDGVTGADYPDLGYTFAQPAVIKAEGHGWVAVFGNGYDSANGKAVLYMANIADGTKALEIDLSAVNATAHDVDTSNPVPNGLSTLAPIDTDGDGDVDLIYGGDLNGNVWRFAATSGTGFASGTTTLLYTAKNEDGDRQPITSRFAVGRHPISAEGRIVYVGTGKYYELDDQDPTQAVIYNSMYGLWDRDNGSTIPSVSTRNSNTLQQQTIDIEQSGTFDANTFDVRVISDNPITWVTRNFSVTGNPWNSCSSSGSCGWYLDLETTGEKMVANPILRGGRLIFVTTIPSLLPCAAGGSGWLMEIDPNTGGRLHEAVFDLNGDGLFDYNDNLSTTSGGSTVYTPVSGKKSKVGILQPPAILAGIGGSGDGSYGGREGKYSSGSRDAQIDVTIENPGILGAGRKSWVRIK